MENLVEEWKNKSLKIIEERIAKNDEFSDEFLDELNARKKMFATNFTEKEIPNITKESITGDYFIVGRNSNASVFGYAGTLSLSHAENQITAQWVIEGNDTHHGYGLLYGNKLCLNFSYLVGATERYGVVVYEFLSDECMGGAWTEETSDTIGCEFGRKVK